MLKNNEDDHYGLHETPQDKCPKCGSDDIENTGPDEDIDQDPVTGEFMWYTPCTCNACGYDWLEPTTDTECED